MADSVPVMVRAGGLMLRWVSARILGALPALLAGDPVVVAVQIRAVPGVSAVERGCACFTGLLAA